MHRSIASPFLASKSLVSWLKIGSKVFEKRRRTTRRNIAGSRD